MIISLPSTVVIEAIYLNKKVFNNIKSNYPKPLVDLTDAGKKARAKIWGFRKSKEVKLEVNRIVKLHTRNN